MTRIPVIAGSPQTVSATAEDQKIITGATGSVAYSNPSDSGTLTAGQTVTVRDNTTLTIAAGKGYVHVRDVPGRIDSVVNEADVVPLKRYGTISATGDHTALFEGYRDEVASLTGQVGLKLVLPAYAKLNVEGISNLRGRTMIDMQGARIRSTAAENTTPIFAAFPGATNEVTIKNGAFITDNRVLEMDVDADDNGLQSPFLERLVVVSTTLFDSGYTDYGDAVSDAFYFRNVDFASLKNIQIQGFNRGVFVDGDWDVDRGNTQFSLIDVYMTRCRLALDLSFLHFADINVDVNRCGSGIMLRQQNANIKFNRCNVQYHGNADFAWSERTGRGFMVNMASTQQAIVFDACKAKEADTQAVAGFEHWTSTGTTTTGSRMNDVVYRSCTSDTTDAPGGYLAADLWGRYTWDGAWPFTTDVETHEQSASVAVSNDGVIRPTGLAPTRSENLLPMSRFNDANDFVYTSGAGSITSVGATGTSMPAGVDIVLNNAITIAPDLVSLKVGWHTLIVNAQSTSADISIGVESAGGTRVAKTRVSSFDTTHGQLSRIPFYVASAGTHRFFIEATNAGSKTIVLGRFGLFRGLVSDLTVNAASDDAYPNVASASTIAKPTTRTIRITGTTTVNTITAGYAGQELVVVFGGLATFADGAGNLFLNGDFVPSQTGSTLTLVCNGTSWFERSRSQNQKAFETVASAATLAAPVAPVMSVTGTTTVTSMTAGSAGQEVTLIFTNALTFTDGSNLKLAGDFVTTADDSISLVCDGTNWYEKCRSTN